MVPEIGEQRRLLVTLRELIVITLNFGANHASAMIANSDKVAKLASRIEALSRKVPLAIGAGDVIALFQTALPRILAEGASIVEDQAAIDRIIALGRAGRLDEAGQMLVPVQGG